jgi:hypothetical protein
VQAGEEEEWMKCITETRTHREQRVYYFTADADVAFPPGLMVISDELNEGTEERPLTLTLNMAEYDNVRALSDEEEAVQ